MKPVEEIAELLEQVVFLGSGYPVELDEPARPGRVAIFGKTSRERYLAVYLDTPTHGFSYVLPPGE